MESRRRRICRSISTSSRSMLSASFSYDSCAHPTLSRRRLGRYSRPCVRRCSLLVEEDDRQAAACSQCCGPNRLQHSQVRSTANWRWTSTTGLGSGSASRCSSVCKTWCLDTCRLSANLCLAFLVAGTSARLIVVNWTPPYQSVHVRGSSVYLRRSYNLKLTS